MSIVIQQLSYIHPDKEVLFGNISFTIDQGQKTTLIGNNGSGKSTLLQLICGNAPVSSGSVTCTSTPYYVPQHFGQYNHLTVAQALGIDKKLESLHAILDGDCSVNHFSILADNWDIEEEALSALFDWGLPHTSLTQPIEQLSGGEKTKIFLAGIMLFTPEIILLDEPTNHLDTIYRNKLYDLIHSSAATLLVVSHDRTLLNLLPSIIEVNKSSVMYYGGNYEFYKTQKETATHSLYTRLNEKEKELRIARKIAKEVAERKQKQDIRGEKHSAKKGVGKMMMNILKDRAEKSSSKLKDSHTEKLNSLSAELTGIRATLPDVQAMKIDFNVSSLHTGKTLITAQNLNFCHDSTPLWKVPLDFQIKSGERIRIKGGNGSGKTTLLKLITGTLKPSTGKLTTTDFRYVYLDQEYSIIRDELSVFEQIQQFNQSLLEHELKKILNRFLFPPETWEKKCKKLSGGEKMKLALSCLMVNTNTPDIFMLDEPTNNIDIRNIEILTSTLKDYRGTILLVSHDDYFVRQTGISRILELN